MWDLRLYIGQASAQLSGLVEAPKQKALGKEGILFFKVAERKSAIKGSQRVATCRDQYTIGSLRLSFS
jgi:hypothetical protein